MVMTPWGPSEKLREQRLSGSGVSREEARANQRQRLYGAMVACCETEGYEATSVADLLEVSGVSRGTFYEHFEGKLACFEATIEAILHDVIVAINNRLHGEGDAEARALAAFDAFVALVVAQPAAARLAFVHAYAAGEPGLEPVRQTIETIVEIGQAILDEMPGREAVPRELARAVIGGFYRIFYERLESGREAELPSLVEGMWRWAMSYETPPQPLGPSGRRRALPTRTAAMPPFAAADPEQRIIRAFAAVVAEKGYAGTTIADVAAAGSFSQSTFYAHFADKADVMAAALDASGAQMLAATLPAARRAPDWAHAVRVVAGTTLTFLATEPGFAELRIFAVYAAGPAAIAQREDTGAQMLQEIIGPVFSGVPELDPLVLEGIFGAINGISYEQLRTGGPASLPDAAPLVTYVALTPLIGAETACEIANGDGRGKRQAEASSRARPMPR